MKRILLLLPAFAFIGCATHAGPFVTSVSNNGDGSLVIEKCMVRLDPWMAVVNNYKCGHTVMKIK